jgi:hypothetical protein
VALHRQPRARKTHFGELIQLDGGFHLWYEDRAPQGCLVTLVDDATGRTLGRLGDRETIWAAVNVLRRWIEQHAVPHALDTDWKNVYVRALTPGEQTGVVPVTQFGSMCAARHSDNRGGLAAGQGARGAQSRHATGSAGEETPSPRDQRGLPGQRVCRDEASGRSHCALCAGAGLGRGLSSSGPEPHAPARSAYRPSEDHPWRRDTHPYKRELALCRTENR